MEVEIPMLNMDDREKTIIVDDDDAVLDLGKPSNTGIPYRRNVQLKKMGVIAAVVFLMLTFLIAVLIMSFVILTKVVNYPDILILGNITGNVTANLGTLGHVNLTPDLQVNIKLRI